MWHVNVAGDTVVKMSEDELLRKLQSEELSLQTKIWTTGMRAWELAEFNAQIRTALAEHESYQSIEEDVEAMAPEPAYKTVFKEPDGSLGSYFTSQLQEEALGEGSEDELNEKGADSDRDTTEEKDTNLYKDDGTMPNRFEMAKKKAQGNGLMFVRDLQDAWSKGDGSIGYDSSGYTKFGVPYTIMAGFLCLLYFGNSTAMIGLSLFLLLTEDSMWLKRTVVTICAYAAFYFLVSDVLYEADNIWQWVTVLIVDGIRRIPVIGTWRVFSSITDLVDILRDVVRAFFVVLMLGHSVKALRGETVKFSRFDKYINDIHYGKQEEAVDEVTDSDDSE
jgi:hypothetical protein